MWVVSNPHTQKIALFIPLLQSQRFLNLLKVKVSALCLKNQKCSFCFMLEYISRQVASQPAQVKQNRLAETYQWSRRNNSRVVGQGADGEYLLKSSVLLVKSPSSQVPSLICE